MSGKYTKQALGIVAEYYLGEHKKKAVEVPGSKPSGVDPDNTSGSEPKSASVNTNKKTTEISKKEKFGEGPGKNPPEHKQPWWKPKKKKKDSPADKLGTPAKLTSAVEKDAMKRYVSEGTADVSKPKSKTKTKTKTGDKKAPPAKNYKEGYYNSPAKTKAPLKKSPSTSHQMKGMTFLDGQTPMKNGNAVSSKPSPAKVVIAMAALFVAGVAIDLITDAAARKRERKAEAVRVKERGADRISAGIEKKGDAHGQKGQAYLAAMG